MSTFWAMLKAYSWSGFSLLIADWKSIIAVIVFFVGLIVGFNIGSWWSSSDFESQRKEVFNESYDMGYFKGYDSAKAGGRRLIYPHMWAYSNSAPTESDYETDHDTTSQP